MKVILNVKMWKYINPFSIGKIENSVFETTIIPQTLNINKLRTKYYH